MQPRPPFDRELLIPITVGIISILGLAWIFLTNYRSKPPMPPTVEPTVLPFNITPPEIEVLPPRPSATLEEDSATATESDPESYPGPPTETTLSTGTLTTENQPFPFVTPTPEQVPPLLAGKHDNTHPNIVYDRHWAFKENSGTVFAYKGTLHVSDSIGNELFFRFTGQRFYLGYQRGRSFGTVTVLIDNQSYSFHEQAFGNIWRSPELVPGTYSVRLIHQSGQSINLDFIEVLD